MHSDCGLVTGNSARARARKSCCMSGLSLYLSLDRAQIIMASSCGLKAAIRARQAQTYALIQPAEGWYSQRAKAHRMLARPCTNSQPYLRTQLRHAALRQRRQAAQQVPVPHVQAAQGVRDAGDHARLVRKGQQGASDHARGAPGRPLRLLPVQLDGAVKGSGQVDAVKTWLVVQQQLQQAAGGIAAGDGQCELGVVLAAGGLPVQLLRGVVLRTAHALLRTGAGVHA
eukprot:1157273-Pelagomonas_calceolata.AAC.2